MPSRGAGAVRVRTHDRPRSGAVSSEVDLMTAMPHALAATPVAPSLHATFLALLPTLQTHAAISFRDVTCPDRRADLVSEAVALAWQWLVRLHARGTDASRFPMAFARLAARAVRSR